jgi:hypothetical protein
VNQYNLIAKKRIKIATAKKESMLMDFNKVTSGGPFTINYTDNKLIQKFSIFDTKNEIKSDVKIMIKL